MNTETNARRRRTQRNRLIGRLLAGCATLAVVSAPARAQEVVEVTPEARGVEIAPEAGGEVYRLAPIIVNAGVQADDDAHSVVAHELWVGGKVATSLLDTPASVSVITEEEMAQRGVETIEDVLSYTPGIVTDYYGSDDRNDYFLLRGFDASTYRDGLTLGSMRGVREEPFAFERVEILKGANSTLFGPSQPGGSINYVTKSPKFEPFGEAYVQGGSFERREIGLDFGDAINESKTLAFRLTAKVKDSELDYAHSRDDEKFIMGGLAWAPTDNTKLTVVADYLDRDGTPNSGGYPIDQEYDRDRFFGEPDFNYHDVERGTVSALFEHYFGGGLSLRANVRYSDLTDDFGYVYITDSAGRTGSVVERDYYGSDSSAQEVIGNLIGQYDASFDAIDSSTVVGAELRNATTSQSSFYGDATSIDIDAPVYSGAPTGIAPYLEEDRDYQTTALFVQQNLSFYDTVIVTGGLRHDWLDLSRSGVSSGAAFDESDDFAEFSLRGAVTWKVTDNVSTYASYVESVAPPSVGLEPERGEQYEIGVKFRPAGFNALFTASIFDLTRKNISISVVQADGSIEQQLIGETRTRGFELEGKAEITKNFSLIAGYAYLDTEVLESDPVRGVDVTGNRFVSTPEHMASVWANYTVPGEGARGDLTFGLGARYTGAYFFNQQNDNGQSDATVLFDASIGYMVTENAEVSVSVANLMDEQHVVGRGTADYYNPGRSFKATLRYAW